MTSGFFKLLVCAVSVGAMVWPTAGDAKVVKKARHGLPQARVADPDRCRGANRFPCGPIYNGNDYLGQDPDPFIRSMIQRDLGAKYGGES